MSLTASVFQNVGSAFQDLGEILQIGGRFESEALKDHDALVKRRRKMEEGIISSLPLMDRLIAEIKDRFTAIAGGATLSLGDLNDLRIVCKLFSALHDQSLENMRSIEQEGQSIDRASEYKARLQVIHEMLGPIGKVLEEAEFRLPLLPAQQPASDLLDAPAAPTAQPAPFDLPLPGTWTPVKARPGPVRLPDPPSVTGEGPAPFDLPRPGTWVPVETRPGPARLPDPIDD